MPVARLQGVFNPREVSVSSNDTTTGNLLLKLQAGVGIAFAEINDGGDEKLEIQVPSVTIITTHGGIVYDSGGEPIAKDV